MWTSDLRECKTRAVGWRVALVRMYCVQWVAVPALDGLLVNFKQVGCWARPIATGIVAHDVV